jgi:hypothetical protein
VTVGLLSVGAAIDILDATFSGFAYPARKQQLYLLGTSASSTGNVVLQESAKGYREASLAFTARDTAEKDTVRGYDETSEPVSFVDFDGSTRSVRVLSFASSLLFGDLWSVTLGLQELAEPVPLGS